MCRLKTQGSRVQILSRKMVLFQDVLSASLQGGTLSKDTGISGLLKDLKPKKYSFDQNLLVIFKPLLYLDS